MECSGLEPAHVQQVVNQFVQPVRLCVDCQEELVGVFLGPSNVRLEQSRR